MMDEEHEHSKNSEQGLRKLLKGLPQVKASPDFEHRLHERMRAKPRDRGWLEIFLVPRRHPIFAYSLASLAIVGLFSYYLFFRTGFVPAPGEKIGPTIQENTAPPVDQINKPVEHAQLKKDVQQSEIKEQPLSQRKIDAPVSGEAEPTKEKDLMDRSSTKAETREPVTQPPMQMDEFQLRHDADKSSREDLKKSLPILGLPAKSQNVDASQAPQMFQMNSASVAVVDRDSLARIDSLKIDSIRNAQKSLHAPVPRAKVKKSGE